MTPDADNYVVHETPQLREQLEELHDLDRGILVCRISSGHRRVEQLANDVLAALGKDLSKRQGARNQSERWQRTVAWVVAHDMREIIVLGADRVGWKAWNDFIDLANFSEARLWLVMRGTTFRRGERDWLNRWHKLETIEGDAMLASVAQRTASTKRRVTSATKQKEPRREFPRVEAASFVLLRALAFESMSTEQFRTFDMSWSDALGKTTDWIDAQPTADELAVATYAARPRFRVRYTR